MAAHSMIRTGIRRGPLRRLHALPLLEIVLLGGALTGCATKDVDG